MQKFQFVSGLLVALSLAGCDMLMGSADGPELVAGAQAKLSQGDLPGAFNEYEALAGTNPDSVHVAVGRAYTQMLSGDLDAPMRRYPLPRRKPVKTWAKSSCAESDVGTTQPERGPGQNARSRIGHADGQVTSRGSASD